MSYCVLPSSIHLPPCSVNHKASVMLLSVSDVTKALAIASYESTPRIQFLVASGGRPASSVDVLIVWHVGWIWCLVEQTLGIRPSVQGAIFLSVTVRRERMRQCTLCLAAGAIAESPEAQGARWASTNLLASKTPPQEINNQVITPQPNWCRVRRIFIHI